MNIFQVCRVIYIFQPKLKTCFKNIIWTRSRTTTPPEPTEKTRTHHLCAQTLPTWDRGGDEYWTDQNPARKCILARFVGLLKTPSATHATWQTGTAPGTAPCTPSWIPWNLNARHMLTTSPLVSMLPSHLGIFVSRLLGPAPAGTALGATLLRAAPGRTAGPAGRLPLATLPGGRLSARGTSLRRHGYSGLRGRDAWQLQTTRRGANK